MKAAEEFVKAMESNNYKVELQITDEGENTKEFVRMGFGGNNFSNLVFHLVFDRESSNSAQFFCNEICKFEETKNLLMLQTVNALNTKYRWVTFFVSENGAVNANMSIEYTNNEANQLFMNYLQHFVGVVDTAYPILMKALYS